jgi:RNA polymerase sigma-70 factor (ECF subfamily)
MGSPLTAANTGFDLEIILGLKQRNPGAMTDLYDRYERIVYSAATRILGNAGEVQDVVQEVFLRVWMRAHLIDPSQSLVPWLLTVTRNIAIDYLRSVRLPDRSIEQTSYGFATAPFAVHYLHSVDGLRALTQLTDEQRQVIKFAYFEGLSQTEISERMARPLGTVKTWTRTALAILRKSVSYAA